MSGVMTFKKPEKNPKKPKTQCRSIEATNRVFHHGEYGRWVKDNAAALPKRVEQLEPDAPRVGGLVEEQEHVLRRALVCRPPVNLPHETKPHPLAKKSKR
jgi:hypothetical protein